MAFTSEVKKAIEDYALGHLQPESWHEEYFAFITNQPLASRLADEFLSTRFVYKVLEGLGAEDWLQRAQVRLQVLSYASIYEAVLHHVLFERIPTDAAVIALTEFPTEKPISIPRDSMLALERHLHHDGKTIIPMFRTVGHTSETKVRFDRKAECAFSLGFITDWLRDDLIEIYEARNAIHIHAEIRKSLSYELELSRTAYMRMEPFREQVSGQLAALGV